MENLKLQIEDFEKELLGLQDQMTHVMKLNSEIGQASEHWEHAYHKLKEDEGVAKAAQREAFNKSMGRKVEKIQQFKRKLLDKEGQVKSLQQEVNDASAYLAKLERTKQDVKSEACQTQPAMELLEQHKAVLEEKLMAVKCDINAVLDQVEKEQLEKGALSTHLKEQKETNKSLIGELDQARKDLKDAQTQVLSLQRDVRERDRELRQMTEAME